MSKNSIMGNGGKLEVDVLKLNSTPMDIQSAEGAVVDFNDVKLLSSDMKWSPAATYNTTTHALEDAESKRRFERPALVLW